MNHHNNNSITCSTICNNCGKPGHAFYQCKHSITSVGIIMFRINDHSENSDHDNHDNHGKEPCLEFLLIKRRFSIGYMEFIRGKYPLYNKMYILNLVSEMTQEERQNIAEKDFDTLWYTLWGDYVGIQYRNEENHSKEKFLLLKSGVKNMAFNYSIESLMAEANSNVFLRWTEPEWGFPKGRHDRKENDLLCALREFEEETGYNRMAVQLVHNLLPVEEIFTGSNYKSYKHKYYVATMDATNPLPVHTSSEVGEMAWLPYHLALEKIRPYNLEKRDILTRVNDILQTYKLVPAIMSSFGSFE
jgi:ADP-ribose pyrophosphatase YjhB (NUDIX family)